MNSRPQRITYVARFGPHCSFADAALCPAYDMSHLRGGGAPFGNASRADSRPRSRGRHLDQYAAVTLYPAAFSHGVSPSSQQERIEDMAAVDGVESGSGNELTPTPSERALHPRPPPTPPPAVNCRAVRRRPRRCQVIDVHVFSPGVLWILGEEVAPVAGVTGAVCSPAFVVPMVQTASVGQLKALLWRKARMDPQTYQLHWGGDMVYESQRLSEFRVSNSAFFVVQTDVRVHTLPIGVRDAPGPTPLGRAWPRGLQHDGSRTGLVYLA